MFEKTNVNIEGMTGNESAEKTLKQNHGCFFSPTGNYDKKDK